MQQVPVPILCDNEQLIPTYASKGAAGADVRAAISEEIVLLPGERKLIPTGLKVAIPEGYEIQLRPRSGLALKKGISLVNTPATIDSDYRGEIGVILINHSKDSFVVMPKMRIAQMVIAPVFKIQFVKEESLTASHRGEGGFGHTGTH